MIALESFFSYNFLVSIFIDCNEIKFAFVVLTKQRKKNVCTQKYQIVTRLILAYSIDIALEAILVSYIAKSIFFSIGGLNPQLKEYSSTVKMVKQVLTWKSDPDNIKMYYFLKCTDKTMISQDIKS